MCIGDRFADFSSERVQIQTGGLDHSNFWLSANRWICRGVIGTTLMNDQFETLEHVKRTAVDSALQSGPKLLVAIAIIVVGVQVGRWAGRMIDGGLRKFSLDPPVRQLLVRIVRVLVLALFAIMALQNLGVELLPSIAGEEGQQASGSFWHLAHSSIEVRRTGSSFSTGAMSTKKGRSGALLYQV